MNFMTDKTPVPTKEEMILGLAGLDLANLRDYAEEIAGEWNGDEPGIQEERAECANEIIEKIDELVLLLKELE